MEKYFIEIWSDSEKKGIKEIKEYYSVEDLIRAISDFKDKKISIYKAKCLLDWS